MAKEKSKSSINWRLWLRLGFWTIILGATVMAAQGAKPVCAYRSAFHSRPRRRCRRERNRSHHHRIEVRLAGAGSARFRGRLRR